MPTQTANDRLDGWKDIGAHLNRHPRTAMRWAEERNLPVHRVPGGDRQAVFAYRHEIEQWLKHATNGQGPLASSPSTTPQPMANDATVEASVVKLRLSRNPDIAKLVVVILAIAVFGVSWHRLEQPAIQITGVIQLSDDGTSKRGLVTDGKRLYFSEVVGSGLALATMAGDGGPIDHIEGPKNPVPEDISPDGKLLLVLSHEGYEEEHDLWIVPTTGEPPHQVRGIKCQTAAWSPNGKWIAFASGATVYLTSPDGLEFKHLGRLQGAPQSIRWSEDGRRLIVLLRNSPTEKLAPWELELDAKLNVQRVISLHWAVTNCCQSGLLIRNRDIYFSVTEDTGRGHLFYLHPRPWWHGEMVRATQLRTHFEEIIALASHKGTQKLFVLNSTRTQGDLVRFDPSTHSFSVFLLGVAARDVDFAKKSDWISYVKPGDNTLWVSRSNGREARQVTPPDMNVELPRWSPDGRRIAFMGRQPNRPWRIFIVPATHGVAKEASQSNDNQGAPTWSPDGRFLIYGNVVCQEEHSCAIRKINLATGAIETLPGSQGLGTARWSPDGRYIGALNPERQELYVFDLDRQKWRKLAADTNGNDLSWSADSRYLYTNRTIKNRTEILRVPINRGSVQTVLNSDPLSESVGHLDTWFGVTPDDEIIMNRWLNTSEIYVLSYRER
jgi:Tol biopolymer transport system component